MSYNKIIYYFSIIGIIFFGSCQSEQKKEHAANKIKTEREFESFEGTIAFKSENYGDEEIIFYNLFSPVDLTYLVSKKEAYYNSSLLNPLNNITKYQASDKVALNLGVYGADISYLWMFDQQQQALSYKAAIHRLTDQLEIPQEFVNFTYSNAESNSQNFDSLVQIAKVTYWKTDEHLKKTGRNHSASLVLLGGWIETLYIATNMYDKPSEQLLGKIALQKFSINSLISLMQSSNNQNNAEYILMLKKLKRAFDKLDVHFTPDNLVIDTTLKHIKLKNHTNLNLKVEDFAEIKSATRQIRNQIIQ